MDETKIHEYANSLLRAHGDAAEAEAAQKARALEESGSTEEAAQWRRVRAAISEMRGPNVS